MKVSHVVVQSDYGKVTVVNLGRIFLPEQFSIIFILICIKMSTLQHIAIQKNPIMGPRVTLYEATAIISLEF